MAFFGGKSKSSSFTEEEKISAASSSIASTFLGFGFGGVIVIVIWSYGVATPVANPPALGLWGFLGTDLLVALAAAAAGSLFGFVFGIPRTLDPAGQVVVASAGPSAVMAANTNLERISDWLTTLLIGATLVQIKDIAHWVGSLGEHLTATGAAANDAMIPIIVIYYFALAFLGVYLITRLYLTSAFQQILAMLMGKKQPPLGIDQLKTKDDALDAEISKALEPDPS
jgi:hypothetical protein